MAPPREPVLALVLVGALRGTLEPCGCTSHPKGGVHRLGHVVNEVRARAAGTLVLSAGDLLYESAPSTTPRGAQERAKAETLVQALQLVGLSAAGRGPLDDGAEALGGAWKSLSPGPAAFVLLQVASVNVGVIAVDPARVEEARVALALARREGASVVLALVAGAMEDAKRLVAAVPGVDFALVRSSQSAQVVPERVGNTAVFEVGSLGEHVGVLELVLPRPGAAIEDGEPGRDALVIANVRLERARLRFAQLTKTRARSEMLTFARAVLDEAAQVQRAAQEALAAQRPVGRNHFRWRVVALDAQVPDEPRLLALRHAYKRRLRTLNLGEAHRFRAPKAVPGAATYVGSERCGACHPSALAFWRKTPHGRAFATLARELSDYDLGCVGCHVTGYLAPGGSSLSERPELRDVGCESCHGPGSLHARVLLQDAEGERARKTTIVRAPAEAVCRQCHTPEHSDLFDFGRYRARQIGPGHGAPLAAAGGAQ